VNQQAGPADTVFEDLDAFMQDAPRPPRPGDDAEVIDVIDVAVEKPARRVRPTKVVIASAATGLGLIVLLTIVALRGPGIAGTPEDAREMLGAVEQTDPAKVPTTSAVADAPPELPSLDEVAVTPPESPEQMKLLDELELLRDQVAERDAAISASKEREATLGMELDAARAAKAAAEAKAASAAKAAAVPAATLQLMLVTSLSDGAVLRDASGSELIAPLGAKVRLDPRTGKASIASTP